MTSEKKILVKNSTQKRVVLILEPWAEQYILQPGVTVELRQIDSTDTTIVEIEYLHDCITVYSGGVVTVFCNGEKLSPVHPWIDQEK